MKLKKKKRKDGLEDERHQPPGWAQVEVSEETREEPNVHHPLGPQELKLILLGTQELQLILEKSFKG